MEVEFPAAVSGNMTAILKLFDPRHPPTFPMGQRGLLRPHGPHDQLAWEDFVRKDKLRPFLDEITAVEKQGLWSAWYELGDEEPQSHEALGRYEAGLYRTTLEEFDSETRAYGRFRDLQGKCIPRLYAHVFIQAQTADPALAGRPEFSIFGIFMESIRGFILEKLPDLPASDAPPKELWKTIVQDAVYAANEINKRGVVMLDCRAGNALVEHDTHRVVIHDLPSANSATR
ncbi:uncharacterized protein PODANS_3_2040 [Podospora anserina S mat+]|uniref:Podospora anserina S mat+ genomic DNA chromosome 3, supercontig 2 n=1 Tax=Podospora anserina (strain S / ATCC MYA-4624 / DSM 980 / FGSC 10383) TaxID=515849 RepID=B2AZY3_PODAN|nr:uncharacterized protein PODANS_3_2040 [Podospora anserina S mat+]CAP70101.1 unnamed protein product [Podospora anserina S mat+]CDP26695.1 Putative protein of unknown function [Podospora anserina S mat+]